MTGKDLLYSVGAIAAGFAAYKIFKTASKISDAGGKVVDGIAAGVTELITKDLNPASPENVVYRGVNVLTGGDNSKNSIGTRIYDYDFKTSPNYTGLNKLVYDFFNPEKKPSVVPVQENVQTQFRRQELIQQSENEAIVLAVENKMSDRRNVFRLSELREEPIRQYQTDYPFYSAPSLNQNTGA